MLLMHPIPLHGVTAENDGDCSWQATQPCGQNQINGPVPNKQYQAQCTNNCPSDEGSTDDSSLAFTCRNATDHMSNNNGMDPMTNCSSVEILKSHASFQHASSLPISTRLGDVGALCSRSTTDYCAPAFILAGDTSGLPSTLVVKFYKQADTSVKAKFMFVTTSPT